VPGDRDKGERNVRPDSVNLEETRLAGIERIEDYRSFHERHRIFPEVFESRNHKKILDISAGVGVVGQRVKDKYHGDIVCNDISPTALRSMDNAGLKTVSFDIDDDSAPYPFPDAAFDAVITLATIEHLVHTAHFFKEINRILNAKGFLYISAPNYSGILYLVPFLITGKTFHDPMMKESSYEFYAHIRYFTYRTLAELVCTFGFTLDAVYLALPAESSRFRELRRKSRLGATLFRAGMRLAYWVSPRWASEPVMCFKKGTWPAAGKTRKVIL
jgi:SAM-dependent methyltransferase